MVKIVGWTTRSIWCKFFYLFANNFENLFVNCRFDTITSTIVKIIKSDILEGEGNATKVAFVTKKFNTTLQKFLKSSSNSAQFAHLPDIYVNEVSDTLPNEAPTEESGRTSRSRSTKDDKKIPPLVGHTDKNL